MCQQYNFDNFSAENGLQQQTIFEIFQDARGYIWLGTEGGGVIRFDGQNFITFSKNSGLAGNTVRSIIEDDKKNIWFATDEGISIYNGLVFKTINESKGLSSNTVVCLYRDSEGSVWAGTAGNSGGLNKITATGSDTFKITVFTRNEGLSLNNIICLGEDSKQRLWAGTFGGGINIIPLKQNKNITYLTTITGFPSDYILSLVHRDSMVWVSTYDKGAYYLKNNLKTRDYLKQSFVPIPELKNSTVWNILPAKDENWLGTNDNGIERLKINSHQFFNIGNGLSKNQIIKLFKDRESNIWISAYDGGIQRFCGDRFINFTTSEGLPGNNVITVVAGKENELWLSCEGEGLVSYNHGKVNYLSIKNGLPSNNISSIFYASNGKLWIGSNKGLTCFYENRFYTYNHLKNDLINDEVTCVYVDQQNTVWVGTRSGLSIYDGQGFKNVRENYLPDKEIQAIVSDLNGRVWCATLKGLIRFSDNNNTLTTFDEKEGLLDKKVNCLAVDKSNRVWIGTFGGGIYVYDEKKNAANPIRQVLNHTQLNSDNIFSLFFEKPGILIAGTDKGMNRIFLDTTELKSINVRKYGLDEGFRGVKNNQNAICKGSDGMIWLGTINGVTLYNPMSDSISHIKPKVVIEDIKIFFEKINWKAKGFKLLPWFSLPENLILPYYQNHITFVYKGLYYRAPKKIKYRYILEGIDKKWSPPTMVNEAVYASLSPGDYIFKVIACNENEEWNDVPAKYMISIKPPFWHTPWFYSLCFVLALIAFIIYIRIRERNLRNEKIRLEKLVKLRTQEVVMQKDEIEKQRDKIKQQHDVVSKQKDEITESIQYASRIQSAVISTHDILHEEFSDYFILYLPRDIVSGDFYWFGKNNNKIIICAADCTGHGVPGALTSMLGISLLNEAVRLHTLISPDEILNNLRSNIISSFKQTNDDSNPKDGMDMAVIVFDKQKSYLEYAGAYNPILVVRKKEHHTNKNIIKKQKEFIEAETDEHILFELPASRMPVAIYTTMDHFRKIRFDILKGDTIYCFSDGYFDQFGGENHRKFTKKRFRELVLTIQNNTLSKQEELLRNKYEEWKSIGSDFQVDDIMVLGLKI